MTPIFSNPSAKKFALFFVIATLFACSCYFAWAWSRGMRENHSLRAQVTALSSQSKATETAIATLRAQSESTAQARDIQSKNEKNVHEEYLKTLEQVKKLEAENNTLQADGAESKKAVTAAQQKTGQIEKELKEKDVIINSQWRRIERLETQAKLLDQAKHDIQIEAKRQKEALAQEQRDNHAQENAVESAEKSVEEAQVENKGYQAALQKKDDMIEGLKEQIEGFKEYIESLGKPQALQAELKKKDQTIIKLQSDLKKTQETLKVLTDKLRKAESKKAKPERSFQDLTKRVLELTQDAATAHYNLGVLYMKSGQYRMAEMEFKYALAVNPNDAAAHYNLAVIQDTYLKNPKEALPHYEAYIRILPKAEDLQKVQYRVFQMRLMQEKGIGKDLSKQR